MCMCVKREFMHIYEQALVIMPKNKTEFAENRKIINKLPSVSQVSFHSHIFNLVGEGAPSYFSLSLSTR